MEYSPKKIVSNLDNKFSFKKKFGQNFIVDENIINSIIKLNSDSNDLEQWRLKHGNKISRIRS